MNELGPIQPVVETSVLPSAVQAPLPVDDSKGISNLLDDIREQELRETDLTRKKVFQAVSEALVATKPVMNKYGSVVGEVADHPVRLAAAREAREMLAGVGIKKSESTGKMPNIIIKHSDGSVTAIGQV